ncbi:MAG: RagB/SusD family nutrient uptake outer membrane protein [Gemmatimonadota bacterium]
MTTSELMKATNAPRNFMHSVPVVGALAIAAMLLSACSADRLEITNPNTPTVEGATSDPQSLQLQATGVLRRLRDGRGGFISTTGIFGRESFNYTPAEGRNTSDFLIGIAGANRIDPAGFANGNWGAQYLNLRDLFNLKNSLAASASITDAQKSAGLGFAKTLEGLELLYVLSTRDSLGIVVTIQADPTQLSPFVSRDSAYKYILTTLDEGNTALGNGGATFPFTLHTGFAGFNTPTTFRQFNRAIAARAAAYYATAGGGATAWQRALTALTASFINTAASTRAALDVGVYHPYSGTAGDAINPLSQTNANDLYAHPSIQTDAPTKADATLDNRYLAKIGTRASRQAPGGFGIASALGFNIYPTTAASIPIIRNEELILLRAEALLATGDKAGALTLINLIRTVSGGLAPSSLTAASPDNDVLTELLLQKRYSLLLEGHRWVDARRYGRLASLPLDISTGASRHFVARVQPIPQAECLARANAAAELFGPCALQK